MSADPYLATPHRAASLVGSMTRQRILDYLDSGCGHEDLRTIAHYVGRALSTVFYELAVLDRLGKIERCPCGRGWLVKR